MTKLLDYTWLEDHTALYLSDPERAHDWDASPVGEYRSCTHVTTND